MLRAKPTADEVRVFRDKHETSIQYAKTRLLLKWRRDCERDLRAKASTIDSVAACREVVIDLLDLVSEI